MRRLCPSFQAWRQSFRAWRIVSTSPLVIEYYVNYTSLDAELIVNAFAGWANFPWHAYAIGIRAEEKGLLAFSADKADAMKVEWMNYIGGPSLDVLSKMLDESITEGYIPLQGVHGQVHNSRRCKGEVQRAEELVHSPQALLG